MTSSWQTVIFRTSSYLIFCCGTNKELSYLVDLSHVSALFCFFQVVVTIFLALVVGAIFFGVEQNQTGSQNRLCFFLCLPNPENGHVSVVYSWKYLTYITFYEWSQRSVVWSLWSLFLKFNLIYIPILHFFSCKEELILHTVDEVCKQCVKN